MIRSLGALNAHDTEFFFEKLDICGFILNSFIGSIEATSRYVIIVSVYVVDLGRSGRSKGRSMTTLLARCPADASLDGYIVMVVPWIGFIITCCSIPRFDTSLTWSGSIALQPDQEEEY